MSSAEIDSITVPAEEYSTGNNFMVTASAEVGGFGIGSQFAWSTTGVVGWRCSRPVGITLGYRYMSVDYKDPGPAPSDSFAYDGNLHGLMLGILLVL